MIIYHTSFTKKTINIKTKNKKLPIICLVIAATFVPLTLPFVIAKLFLGYVPFWANRTLIMNSEMNSIVYFFNGKLKTYGGKKSTKSKHIAN